MRATEASHASAQRATLLVVCLTTFVLLLNVSSPLVALPDIGDDLGASFTDLQWVLSAYALTLASVVLLSGTLADHFGRRRMTLAGGLAGVGAGMLFATSLALLATAYPDPFERARALGVWGATIGVAFSVGPVIGGGAIELADWRWAFALNVPLCLGAGSTDTPARARVAVRRRRSNRRDRCRAAHRRAGRPRVRRDPRQRRGLDLARNPVRVRSGRRGGRGACRARTWPPLPSRLWNPPTAVWPPESTTRFASLAPRSALRALAPCSSAPWTAVSPNPRS